MHKTPQSPEHPSLHEKKTHFYKQAKEALPFLYTQKNSLSGRFPDPIIVVLGNRNQCELLTLEIHFLESVWSLVGLRPWLNPVPHYDYYEDIRRIWKIDASLSFSPVFLFTAQTVKNHKGGTPLFLYAHKNGLSGRFPDSIIVVTGNRNQCELLTLGCNP